MRAFTQLTASLLLILVPALALAIEPLSGRMICDSDGDTVWGSTVDAIGQAQIGEKGDFKFSIKGLLPNTTYTCELDCRATPTGPLATVLTESCTTSRSGNLTSKFSRAAAPAGLPDGGCFTPQVSVLLGATLVCISGYGTVDVP